MMFELPSIFAGWLQNLSPFETAMIVMVFWISATIAAVTIQSTVQARRGPIAATLMFGSFMMTALMVAFLLFCRTFEMTKVSIQSQIAAVEAAADGKATTLRGNARELLVEQLRAAAATLRFVRRHETEIRALAEKSKGGAV